MICWHRRRQRSMKFGPRVHSQTPINGLYVIARCAVRDADSFCDGTAREARCVEQRDFSLARSKASRCRILDHHFQAETVPVVRLAAAVAYR